MKAKNILSVMILTLMCSCSNDKNNTISPDPISELKLDNLIFLNSNIPQDFYTDLTFTDDNIGYAISRTGVILKTTDGGINWVTYQVTGNIYLKKIQFINANIGYIIGGDTSGSYLLKTINAGQTWDIIDLHNPEAGFPSSMFFKNENEGYITGNKLFIKTIDGGQNWTNVFTQADENFADVNFKNDNFGLATVNTGDYYRTTNGGASWQSIELNRSYNLNQIYFVCDKTLIKSGNQLVDIESSSTITLPNPVNKLQYLNTTKCIGIGQHYEASFFPYGDILLTNNNWETFLQKSYQPSSEAMDFTAMAKVNNHKTMMIGTGQLETKIVTINY